MGEIEARWRAYWAARGQSWATDSDCYDRYVYPGTRVPIEQVLLEHPSEDSHD